MIKFFLVCLSVFMYAQVILTDKEKKFIKNHPILILGTSIGWEPYSITKPDKSVDGYDMDILNLVNKYTGIRFIEQTGDWLKIQKLAKNRKIDGLSEVIKTPAREKYFNFSIPFNVTYVSVLVQAGNPKKIHSEEDLVGKTIALQNGNALNQKLAKKWNKSKIIWFDNPEDLLKAVIYGKVDATYDVGIAEYVSSTKGYPFLQRVFSLKHKIKLKFAIRKDYPEAISILNKGLKNISESDFIKIRTKWLLYSPNDYTLEAKEKKYLQTHTIKICLSKNSPPFSFYDNGYKGISVDILKIMQKQLNPQFKIVNDSKKCDLYPIVTNQNVKKTLPYLSYKIMAISNSTPFLHFADIKNKKIVLKNPFLINILKQRFKNIKIIKVNTLKKQFEMANKGYVTLSIMPIFKYYKNIYPQLKIVSYTGVKYNISMGTNNEVLLSILNKKLKSISSQTKQAIEEKWIDIKVIKETDYKIIIIIVVIFIGLLILTLYWIDKLNNLNKKLIENQKALQIEKDKAQKAEKIKSEFLANMSHEIRTPLNAMFGFIQILQDQKFDDETKKYLNIIEKSGQNLLTIIDDILDFSKLESGKLHIEKIEFNLKDDIEILYSLFESSAQQKDILFEKQQIDLKYNIFSDPTRIKQVIANLVSNAIKFTPKGRKVNLLVKYDEQKEELYVEIKDDGIGIEKTKLIDIFKAFIQADSSTTRKYGGTGLGLSISYKLVNLLGGELKVESEVDKGSKFYFTIPAKKGNIISNKIKKKQIIKDKIYSYHILLVEDNRANQMFMKVLLKRLGVTFDIANDGIEAVDKFIGNKYDVILMDENMPNMNGIEATKKIRQIEREKDLNHTIIVALTANALEGDKERFILSGMDYYLSKPLDIEKLKDIFNKLEKK